MSAILSRWPLWIVSQHCRSIQPTLAPKTNSWSINWNTSWRFGIFKLHLSLRASAIFWSTHCSRSPHSRRFWGLDRYRDGHRTSPKALRLPPKIEREESAPVIEAFVFELHFSVSICSSHLMSTGAMTSPICHASVSSSGICCQARFILKILLKKYTTSCVSSIERIHCCY